MLEMHAICYTFLVIISVSKSEYLGDDCTLPSKANGTCTLFLQCESAIHDKENGKYPQLCGFQGIQPIICCEDNKNIENKPKITKSKQKCDEYLQEADFTFPPSIVNGVPAEAREFPHMVALGYGPKESIEWLCGGSLISQSFVLTAAHCVSSPSFGLVQWAKMGTINLKEPEKGGIPQDFEIVERYIHPDYKVPITYNDIAILKLSNSVSVNEFVHPACINQDSAVDKVVQAIGWGKTGFADYISYDLLKVDLEIYSNDTCKKSYSSISKRVLPQGILDEKQVCAGGSLDESKDTCQGDSGGPLHMLLKSGSFRLYNLIGVTSFGKACGIQNVPGVYTRVSYYVSWIENIVWP